ncbi:DMT family transporter [bacterium]|jgi:drug/metabolite transporter (DMT)-like permease|nr:DMT family transporter [Euryarchaeota archaeon]MDB4602724.1 DMT family transporter [Euryarchaeota archaeon]MDC3258526.1 DMT family transporter [bacterium]MDC3309819.1 DMT family transporter [Candidatus Poseidoniales archaeon]|tara:strand:- start:1830 stop:2783 length:954 start_codon:yes stop_codon:yes gene_type:complete
MSSKGLGRGLESISELAKDGPDLSSYVTLESKNPVDSPKVAVLWMIFGSICFGTMNALVKWTSINADVWMIIFIRSLVIALAVAIFARFQGISLKMNDPRKMFLRCLVGLIAMILYFSALSLIPIGQAVTLQYTAPLFVALLSGSIIREKVSTSVLISLITAFFGIILIVSPDLDSIDPNALLALGSGFFAGLAYIFVRDLRKTDSPSTVVFWFAAFSVLGSVFQAAPELSSLTWEMTAALVGIGVGAGGGQVGITMAYHQANAAWVSAFSYLTVIIATIYGIILFDEVLSTKIIIGGLLIIGSGVALIFFTPSTNE